MAMSLENKKRIVEWAVNKTRAVILYSSNLKHVKAYSQTAHHLMQLHLARAHPKTPQQKAFVEELRNWNLDLSSPNQRYPFRSAEFKVETYNTYLTIDEIIQELKEMHPYKSRSPIAQLEVDARRAMKFGIGNCGETSSYAFLLMLEYPNKGLPELGLPEIGDEKIPIERVGFTGDDDHVFIIVGRDQNTDINDPTTWSDDTIIADAWTKEVYTKGELFGKKKNDAEKKFLLNKFKSLTWRAPSDGFDEYLLGGNLMQEKIHSNNWYEKIDSKKPWRQEENLINIHGREVKEEKLPEFHNRYSDTERSKLLKAFNKLRDEYIKIDNQFTNQLNKLKQSVSCSFDDLYALSPLLKQLLDSKRSCMAKSKEIELWATENKSTTPNVITNFLEHNYKTRKFNDVLEQIYFCLDKFVVAKDTLREKQTFSEEPIDWENINEAYDSYEVAGDELKDLTNHVGIPLDIYPNTKNENEDLFISKVGKIRKAYTDYQEQWRFFDQSYQIFEENIDSPDLIRKKMKFNNMTEQYNKLMYACQALQDAFQALPGCEDMTYPDEDWLKEVEDIQKNVAAICDQYQNKKEFDPGKEAHLREHISKKLSDKIDKLNLILSNANVGSSQINALQCTLDIYQRLITSITQQRDVPILKQLETALSDYSESDFIFFKKEEEFFNELIAYTKNPNSNEPNMNNKMS